VTYFFLLHRLINRCTLQFAWGLELRNAFLDVFLHWVFQELVNFDIDAVRNLDWRGGNAARLGFLNCRLTLMLEKDGVGWLGLAGWQVNSLIIHLFVWIAVFCTLEFYFATFLVVLLILSGNVSESLGNHLSLVLVRLFIFFTVGLIGLIVAAIVFRNHILIVFLGVILVQCTVGIFLSDLLRGLSFRLVPLLACEAVLVELHLLVFFCKGVQNWGFIMVKLVLHVWCVR